jgi:hypothetical protein
MNQHARHWHPVAAYLFVLHLDGPSLAWEYLRRNPDYRDDWRLYRGSTSPQCWYLRQFEDPVHDARCVQPVWLAEVDASIPLRVDDDPPESAPIFRLWDIPGHKTLSDDGQQLRLTSTVGRRIARMTLARDLEDGMPYAYAVRAGLLAGARWRAIEAQLAVLDTVPTASHPRPSRTALAHMHALQALDGVLAGASQREVAAAVFGRQAVAERWYADGDLRAHVRRTIRAGKALMRGGYRRLLQLDLFD